jgi:hypothetical protein
MPDEQDDKMLEENLSRLLRNGGELPKLDPKRRAEILEALRAKQAKERTMSASAPAPQRIWRLVVAAAAALLLAWLLFPRSPQREDGAQRTPSGEMRFGNLVKRVLPDGTVLIADQDARLSTEQARRLRLDSGRIYLIVAKGATPFVVETPHGSATARGTRFAVATDAQTAVAVAQGIVKLSNPSGDEEVGAGEEGILLSGQKPSRAAAPRISHLISWAREALAQAERLVQKEKRDTGELVAVDPWGQEVRLTLRKYLVDIYIEDGIARTTVDQTFFNHMPSNIEGTFYFPLPPDASVSRLAMYVNGELMEGGMVERSRGQEIYTQILYQRRDPALLEMMEGNVFKMRIFPIEGRQEKRIFISYTQKLSELYGTLRYWFPMEHTQDKARELGIHVHVKGGAGLYAPHSSTHALAAKEDKGDIVLDYKAKDVKPNQDFLLHLAPEKSAPREAFATLKKDGMSYVFGRVTPGMPGHAKAKPRQWIVLNDISASRSKLDVQAQAYILGRLIEEADDFDRIVLINANTKARVQEPGLLSVRNPEARRLVEAAKVDLPLGGTNLAAAFEAAADLIRKQDAPNPHILYLGDGVATDGKATIDELLNRLPKGAIFVGIGVGKKADAAFLQAAADHTGGMFTLINPDEDIDWRVFDLVAALNTPRLVGVTAEFQTADGKKADIVAYPSARALADGETLFIVGRTNGALPASLVLRGELGDAPFEQRYALAGAKPDGEFIPRLWAKRHIDELLQSGPEHKDEIVALSKQYYVMTPFSSLIVLENEQMYREFNVERGRKDHWALYPAPPKIPVVKEEIDWRQWSWWGYGGEDQKVKAKGEPKSVKDIVESVQFRINAPFYYWRPQRDEQGRFALYDLLDAKGDPTRLMMVLLNLEPRQKAAKGAGGGKPPSPTAKADIERLGEPGRQASEEVGDDYSFSLRGPLLIGAELVPTAVRGPVTTPAFGPDSWFSAPGEKYKGSFEGTLAWGEGLSGLGYHDKANSYYMPLDIGGTLSLSGGTLRLDSGLDVSGLLSDGRPVLSGRLLHEHALGLLATPAATGPAPPGTSGGVLPGTDGYATMLGTGLVLPARLNLGLDRALTARFSRIQRDIEGFNARYGDWDGRSWGRWGKSGGLDLRKSWRYRGTGLTLEALDLDEKEEDLQVPIQDLPLGGDALTRLVDKLPSLAPARTPSKPGSGTPAWRVDGYPETGKRHAQELRPLLIALYGRAMDTVPGTTGALAADCLIPRRDELLKKTRSEQEEKELAAIGSALQNAESAYSLLEDSGVFWGWQAWQYRPQPWTFQPPQVQAYPHHNWAFDLTRYAPGLYSTTFDIVNLVADEHGMPPAGKVSDEARAAIEAARKAIQPVKVRFGKEGPPILVASGDRFAVTRKTEMWLEERMVCDGESVYHLYGEIGLAARRKATELRRAALRQLAPHLVEPADWMARKFDVELAEKKAGRVVLKLSPIMRAEKGKEAPKPPFHILVAVAADGRILEKSLVVKDKPALKLAYTYQGAKVAAKWLDAEGKELGAAEFEAEPFTPDAQTFKASLAPFVVFDMPIRRPSYYQEQLKKAERDLGSTVELKRHLALAHIQEANWRRWGGSNNEAYQAVAEALAALGKAGEKGQLGDLTLIGSCGYRGEVAGQRAKTTVAPTEPVVRYYASYSGSEWQQMRELRMACPATLIGHLSAYHAAVSGYKMGPEFENFLKEYAESPLVLAAVFFTSNWGSKPEAWEKLYDHPRWRALAILMAASHSQQKDTERLAQAFAKLHKELSDKGIEVPLPAQFEHLLRNATAAENRQAILRAAFKVATDKKRVGPLLRFAEMAMRNGEDKMADEALAQARKLMKEPDSLNARLALAQTYWAGGRPKDALKLHDEVLAALDAKGIPASSAFLAATARLAEQGGEHGRAVELEERSLALEHKHLPDLIDLNAFRQRYQWLWGQYQDGVGNAMRAPDGLKTIPQWLARARAAWLRWHEVDHENSGLFAQMAALQMTAARADDAWLYLSSIIDAKPKDAQSYYDVGSWYLGRSDRESAQQWYARSAECDTANPRWLFERGRVLKDMGRKADAQRLFRQVAEGKWAPGLQNYAEQAKKELEK